MSESEKPSLRTGHDTTSSGWGARILKIFEVTNEGAKHGPTVPPPAVGLAFAAVAFPVLCAAVFWVRIWEKPRWDEALLTLFLILPAAPFILILRRKGERTVMPTLFAWVLFFNT